jgi:hypothetical protein
MASDVRTPVAPVTTSERLAAVLHSWRLMGTLIAGGVMALIVVTVVGFSSAYFTASSTSPQNEFGAAEVRLALTNPGPLIPSGNWSPGVTRGADQTVTNVHHKSQVTLSGRGFTGSTTLPTVLVVSVTQTNPNVDDPLYFGPLDELDEVDLGVFGAAEQRTYRIEILWPDDDTDPALRGQTVDFEFAWNAASVS